MPRALLFDASRPAHWHFDMQQPAGALLDPSNPKWVQICIAGSYVYGDTPVTIAARDFDQMVENFRASPAYKPDGRTLFGATDAAHRVLAGPYGVVALNFDHPPHGAPRPGHGWFLELERRGDQLWGLCWFDAEAHAGMLAGSWKWTSIEWQGETKNNRGETIGCYLSGVALTNDPFITGMTPIQMSRRFAGSPPAPSMVAEPTVLTQEEQAMVDALGEEERKRYAADPAAGLQELAARGISPERAKAILAAASPRMLARSGVVWFGPATDVLCELRRVFRLPESADVGAVIGEVAKLRAWALGQAAAPLGVDVAGLVTGIRSLLNLPTLADAATIFAELDKLLGALADEQEEETPMPPNDISPTAPAPGLGLARLFASRFSALTRAVVTEDEPSLVKAFDAMSGRYEAMSTALAAVEGLFGTSDPKQLADKIAAFAALKDQMGQILGEASADNAAEEMAEGEMAKQDVAQVMAAQRLDPRVHKGTFDAYLLQRLGTRAPLVAPTPAEIAAAPAKLTAFQAAVRARREERPLARQHFFDAHGFSDQQKLLEQLPPHLRGALAPALFGAGGHFSSAPLGAPGQVGKEARAAMQFGGASPGQPFTPGAHGGAWTMDRLHSLPGEGDVTKKLAAELNRVEFEGKATPGSAAYDRLWQRVSAVLAEAQRN